MSSAFRCRRAIRFCSARTASTPSCGTRRSPASWPAHADIQEVCDRLVEAALEHGGRDNVTVVALRYGEFRSGDSAGDHRRRRYRPRTGVASADTPPAGRRRRRIWKTRRRCAAAPSRTAPRPHRAPEPMSHRSRRQTNSTNGMLVGLLMLVTAVAAAEGYLLYQNGLRQAQSRPDKATAVPPKPVYDLHNYGTPKLMTTKEVQDACLLLDDAGQSRSWPRAAAT